MNHCGICAENAYYEGLLRDDPEAQADNVVCWTEDHTLTADDVDGISYSIGHSQYQLTLDPCEKHVKDLFDGIAEEQEQIDRILAGDLVVVQEEITGAHIRQMDREIYAF